MSLFRPFSADFLELARARNLPKSPAIGSAFALSTFLRSNPPSRNHLTAQFLVGIAAFSSRQTCGVLLSLVDDVHPDVAMASLGVTRIVVATGTIVTRTDHDGLAALAQSEFGPNPHFGVPTSEQRNCRPGTPRVP